MINQELIFNMYIEIEDVTIELENEGVNNAYVERLRSLRDDLKHMYINNTTWKAEKSYV